MRLCFDATAFGADLESAIELASANEIGAIEYSFAPFAPSTASKQELKAELQEERLYFEGLRARADAGGVSFAVINIDYVLDMQNKSAQKQFLPMIKQLARVAEHLGCNKIAFYLAPPRQGKQDLQDFARDFQTFFDDLLAKLGQHKKGAWPLKFLLRLDTPKELRGQSIKYWRPFEPDEWRALLAACPGLGLSYSPGDCLWMGLDYLQNLSSFASSIEHVSAHDVELNRNLLNDSGMFGPLFWRYRLVGKGQVDWRQVLELLKLYDYQGCLSLQFDDEFIEAGDTLGLLEALNEQTRVFRPLVRG